MKEGELYKEFLPTGESLIDDIPIELFRNGDGPPILFPNGAIRKMLKLVDANEEDVLCDLGCGVGQNLIIAASEFGVRECIGIENDKPRMDIARRRVARWERSGRISKGQIEIRKGTYQEVIRNKKAKIDKATIILFLLDDVKILDQLAKNELPTNGCRFVYYNLCLYPQIFPSAMDYPFYYSRAPFNWTRDQDNSELAWLRKVVRRKRRPLSREVEVQELWDELTHDLNVEQDPREGVRKRIKEYRDYFLNPR